MKLRSIGLALLLVAVAAASVRGQSVAITHDAVECVVADRFPSLSAQIDPAAAVSQARVYFRPDAETAWYFVEMNADAGAFHAALPKPKASLERFSYYIEALDGAFAASRSSEFSPVVVDTAAECDPAKIVAKSAASGRNIRVGAPAATGGPVVPAGFATTGVVALAGARSGPGAQGAGPGAQDAGARGDGAGNDGAGAGRAGGDRTGGQRGGTRGRGR